MNLFKKALQARQADEKGFTLIELIIVIAIIGILVAIAIPVFGGQKDNARLASSKTDARNIGMGIDTSSVETGSFPSTLADSTTKVGEMSLSKDNVFTDYEVAPDGRSFSFFVTNDKNEKSTYAVYDSAHGGLCAYGFGTPGPCGDTAGGGGSGDGDDEEAPLEDTSNVSSIDAHVTEVMDDPLFFGMRHRIRLYDEGATGIQHWTGDDFDNGSLGIPPNGHSGPLVSTRFGNPGTVTQPKGYTVEIEYIDGRTSEVYVPWSELTKTATPHTTAGGEHFETWVMKATVNVPPPPLELAAPLSFDQWSPTCPPGGGVTWGGRFGATIPWVPQALGYTMTVSSPEGGTVTDTVDTSSMWSKKYNLSVNLPFYAGPTTWTVEIKATAGSETGPALTKTFECPGG